MADRRHSDHWTRKAQRQGFAARSVFKLDEIADRSALGLRGASVVDLGCSPGSWSQYAAREGAARVVGVDLTRPVEYPGELLEASVFEVTADALRAALGGPADVLLSDMAPSTSGNRFTDHVRQLELAQAALALAEGVLRPGGAFVSKVFDGEDAPAFVEAVRARFKTTRRVRPKAVRAASVEFFVVGTGWRALSDP